MKCIKNKKTGDIIRVENKTADQMVGLTWQFVSKTEWRKSQGLTEEKVEKKKELPKREDARSLTLKEQYKNDTFDTEFNNKYVSNNYSYVDDNNTTINDSYESIQQRYSDVIIKRDPFEFIADDVLYFGEDQGETPKIMNNNWCISKLSQLLQNNKFKNELNDDFLNFEYVNNGVMGGYHDSLSYFLEQVCTVFDQLECGNNNNMMVTNYLLWKNKIQYFKGAPLTSPFKKYQMHGDYYFIHK